MDGQSSRSLGDAHVDSFTAKAHGHVPEGAFVVPDPHLIFNGEFKRTGLDLVLSHEGHEFVVHDYFRGDKRAALASPDGAHLSGDVVNALTGYVQVAQAAPGAAAAQVIGHVTKLVGSATAIRNGVSVILNNGDNVEKGDVVSTGADSTLGITFIDGTVFGLSSNARMVLNEMVYDPNGSSNSSLLSLVAGTITFVAGETAKHGDMKIDTPVATMGIRGTAVLTQINFVVPAGGGDPQPQASFQVLVEPNGTTGSYILFDKVTLLPIATVNQAGQMIQISGGNVSISNALMSPDVQKLITDVFTLKFTDNNTNTKLTTNFTDTLTPIGQEVLLKSASGAVVTATFVNLNPQGQDNPTTSTPLVTRMPGQPLVQSLDLGGNVKTAFALTERADTTGDTAHTDTVSGRITFVDQNLGDRPTVSISLADAPNYVYKNAGQQDVTGSLSALQKQDIAATQIQIGVAADGGNNNNGSAVWTYTIPDNVFDFLAAGETLTLTYMVRVDTNFAVNPESKFVPITVTITGTNDKPTVATSGGAVIEQVGTGNEALDVITGTVTFADVDLTDRPIVSAELSSVQPFKYLDAEGNDITATLTPTQLAAISAVKVPLTVIQGAGNGNNGSATWTYSVPDHLFDFLGENEKLILNYVVQVDDGHGGVVSTPLTVSIDGADVNVEGTNDVPTIVEDSTTPTGAVKEDAAATLLASGTIAFNDPDLTDTHGASFVLKSTTSNAHLPGFGNGTSHIGTFALTGVSESPGVSTRGSVGWTFTLNDTDPVLQSLAEGQTITQVYTVKVDDHHGGTVTRDVTVTITGTNDAPTITSDADAAKGGVTEDAGATLSTGGTLVIQDLDLIDTHTAQAVFKSATSNAHLPGFDGNTPLGTFTIDQSVTESNGDTSNGATLGWHFVLNDNDPVLQSLAEGQTITQVYTVTFTDDHGAQVSQDVTITITGTNDAPTITSDADAAKGGVTEDAGATLSTGGTLVIQDLDLIDTHTAQAVFKSATSNAHLPGFDGNTPLGTFTIDQSVTESNGDTSNGATLGWHFVLNDNDPVLQSLAEGQTITQVYTVTFTDDDGAQVSQDVTITITGANDAPIITSDADAAKGSVTEDSGLTRSIAGTLAIQDLDLVDTHTAQAVFTSSSVSSALPGFGANANIGTFTIDPSVLECSTDTNNGATLGWHFTLDNNNAVLQSLAEGQTITQVYTVTFTDNHGAHVSQEVTVTITGVNDTPIVTSSGAAATGHVIEDAGSTLTVDGTLAIQDLDLIDTHSAQAVFTSSSVSSPLPGFGANANIGTFTIDPLVLESNTDTNNGATLKWHFSLDNSNAVLQSLAQGQSITQVYTVTFKDNHNATVAQDVTVTITGVNDGPTITSDADAAKGAVIEDDCATLTASGTVAIQDVDLIDTHTAQAVFKSSSISSALPGFETDSHIGTFSIGSLSESNTDTSNGASLNWQFTLDNSNPVLQSLAEGQIITQVYTVTFTDNHGAQVSQDVTVTIAGTNDAPAVSYVTSDYMNFDGATIAVGEVPTVATDDVTLDGWVNWNGNSASASQVLFYNGNTSTAGFGLMGTVITGKLEIAILEGGVEIQDTGFALSAGEWHNLALTRDDGIFTLYVDGNAVYSHTGGVNSIGYGGEPSYMMIGAASDRYAPGFGAQGFTGSISDVSVWTTALTQAQIQSIDFTALAGNEANLAGYYQLADGSGSTAANAVNSAQSLTIQGDADWASSTVANLVETDAGQLAHAVLTVSDVDATDHVLVSVDDVQVKLDGVTQTGSVGGLSHANLVSYLTVPSGDILNGAATHAQFTWQFNSADQAFDFLAAGQTLSLQYTIIPSDAHGAGTSAIVTVNIAGTNDAPTLSDLHIGPLTDTAAADTFSDLTGQLAGTDADSGETATLTYAVLNSDHYAATTVAGLYGSLTVNPNGSYSYVPNVPAINALAHGSYVDTFTVQTKDAHGATDTATLTVDLTGTNDAPVIDITEITVGQEGDQVFVHGISVGDADASADETFTLTATADSGTYVDPASTSDTLDNVNSALQTLTYTDASQSASTTDTVAITVTDRDGATDTVNLIFNLSEQGPVTLAGTPGKDVLFGTGYQDQFLFAANSNHDTIVNFTSGTDKIDLPAVVTASNTQDWLDDHAALSGSDTLITINATDTILLKGVASVQANDFIVHA
nr:VCBS domain-containing protein [Bradyrhizobium sp. 199]